MLRERERERGVYLVIIDIYDEIDVFDTTTFKTGELKREREREIVYI